MTNELGNHKLEHRWIKINTTSPKVSKVVAIETQKQHIGIDVTQSFNVVINTTRVDMVVVPNMNVVKRGVIIKSAINLGCGLGGF
jgi:hypothetical protein